MTALDLFETLEFGADHVGPALFPVALFKSSREAHSFTATEGGGARRDTGDECVEVPFHFPAGNKLEQKAAENLLLEAREARTRKRLTLTSPSETREVMVYGPSCRLTVRVAPEAGLHRVVRGGRSGLVVLDANYVW